MTACVSLSEAAQILMNYGLGEARLQLLSDVDCTVFRVDSHAQSAVFKVYPGHKDPIAIEAEVDWLTALSDDGNVIVPRPLPARDGSLIQLISAFPPRRGVLFSWVPGRSLDRELTAVSLHRAGGLVGKLHRHSEGWTRRRASGMARRTFSQQAPSWVLNMDPPPTMAAADWQVLVEAARRLQREIAAIGETGDVFGFIHSDLYISNFLFQGDAVAVVDFSDCAWGHYADDIASALVHLKHPFVGNFDHSGAYESLRDAFFRGYEEVRALPPGLEDALETYFAARIFLVLSYVHQAAGHLPWGPECVARSVRFLKDYIATKVQRA